MTLKRKFRKGFTLIEIMVVVGIVSLLLSFVVPQMLRSRMNANELAAIAALRHIYNACQCYYNNVSPHTYPPDLLTLNTVNPPYIDQVLASAVNAANSKQGYYFIYDLSSSESFSVIAKPVNFSRSGGRNFFVNELGLITYTKIEDLDPTIDDDRVE